MNESKTRKNAAQKSRGWESSSHVHTLLLIAVTFAGIYLCYLLAAPFLPAFTWALTLSILITPLYRRLESKMKHPNLTAAFCVLVTVLIIVVPATFLTGEIIGEAARSAETMKAMVESGEWRRVFDAHPRIAPVVHWIERQFDLPAMANNITSWLTDAAGSFVQGSALQLIGVVLTFYIFFYFLRDRGAVLDWIRSLSPFTAAEMTRMFDGVNDTVHATIYGTFAVALVQGTLGGLMFWWLDLPAPILWGIVMALLAIIPVLGAFIVWVPAAAYLFLDGSIEKAMLLTLWGTIVVGGIDNLLYPILVGRRMKIHTVLAFISIVGGLIVFGASGLILGPVIFTVTRLILEIWTSQNNVDQINDKGG